MLKIYTSILCFFLFLNFAFSQDCTFGDAFIELDVNNVSAGIQTSGGLWWDGNDSKYLAPKPQQVGDAIKTIIFSGGLWVSALDENGLAKSAAQIYTGSTENTSDMFPGPLDPNTSFPYESGCADWNTHFSVKRTKIDNHLADFAADGDIDSPLQDIYGWPGKDNPHFANYRGFDLPTGAELAPFIDTDGDEVYNPAAGDYPDIKGDEAIWWVFNDAGNIHTTTNGDPLHVEMQAIAYAFQSFEPAINNTTFYDIKYLYRGTETLTDFQTGLLLDPDLGCRYYHAFGIDTLRDLTYYYNIADIDGAGEENCLPIFGDCCEPQPMFGVKLLSDSENLGITSFNYAHQNWSQESYLPSNPVETHNILTGNWTNGTPLTVGGDGYQSGGANTNYAFFGNPAAADEWSMCSAFEEVKDNTSRSTVMSSGGLTAQPGYVKNLTFAVIYVPQTQETCPDLTDIQDAADVIEDFDFTVSNLTESQTAADLGLILSPNPARENIFLSLKNTEEKIKRVEVTGLSGKIIRTFENTTDDNLQVSVSDFASGMYLIRVTTQSQKTAVRKFIRQ